MRVITLLVLLLSLACQRVSGESSATGQADQRAPAESPTPNASTPPTVTPSVITLPTATSAPAPTATLAPSAAAAPAPPQVSRPTFIEMHLHPIAGISYGEFVSFMDRAGVSNAVVMPNGPGLKDEDALEAATLFPERFIPFAGGEHLRELAVAEKEAAWRLESPRVQEYLRALDQALTEKKFRGIGEVYTNHEASPGLGLEAVYFPTDSPLLLGLLRLSGKHQVPLSVHMNLTSVTGPELERALAAVPQGIFLWAHCGGTARPAALRPLLLKHPNLYCELSARDPDRYGPASLLMRGDRIAPEWSALLEDFSDRFMIGVDADTPRELRNKFLPWAQYHLAYLEQLSPEAGARIREGNARRLLGLNAGSRVTQP